MGMTVAIVGVGLIGGSFALALRKAGLADHVYGVSSPATIAKAVKLGIVDDGLSLDDALAKADLVFLSATIRSILDTLPALAGKLKAGALITDAGSTKRRIVDAAAAVPGLAFVGGHPMAGKERSGVEQADADLFVGRPWVLCPSDAAGAEGLERLQEIIRAVGAEPIPMTAADHDAVVARTSHLPQLLSTALAASLDRHLDATLPLLAGPGLLDATRLALSPFHVWRDILETNRDQIVAAMDELHQQWGRQREKICEEEGLQADFERAGEFTRKLRRQ